MQRLQLFLHLLSELEVERPQRLIEQQHLRTVDQRTCERHALALATGELRRTPIFIFGELHHGERVARFGFALSLRHALDPETVGDILADRHMRKQRIVLKHGIDVALVRRNALGGFTENFDMAFVGLFEPRDQAQAGGFA